MKKKNLVLAADFGTESVRVAAVDKEGVAAAESSWSYRTYYPNPGWAEQRPHELWTAFLHAARSVSNRLIRNEHRINAVCLDTTAATILLLDGNMRPIRNAILWMDVRAGRDAQDLSVSGVNSKLYHDPAKWPATWLIPRIRWLQREEPEIYRSSRVVCELIDWLNYRLTGRMVSCRNTATIKWYYNVEADGWPDRLYADAGLHGFHRKRPQEVISPGTVISTIGKECAEELGLDADVLVVQGGADAFVGLLGMGVTQPGQAGLITGSSHVMLAQSNKEVCGEGLYGPFPDGIIPGLFLLEGSQTATGAVLQWFIRELEAAAPRDTAGTEMLAELDKAAQKIPAGSEGVIVLDHWQGNRNPFMDPFSKGIIYGLTLKHSLVHIYRAIMEAVCCGTKLNVERFKATGNSIDKLIVTGGVCNSSLWLQIHSDVLQMPLYTAETKNAPLLGCAVLAKVGEGTYRDISEAVDNMVPEYRMVEPNPATAGAYMNYFEKYIQLYDSTKEISRSNPNSHKCFNN